MKNPNDRAGSQALSRRGPGSPPPFIRPLVVILLLAASATSFGLALRAWSDTPASSEPPEPPIESARAGEVAPAPRRAGPLTDVNGLAQMAQVVALGTRASDDALGDPDGLELGFYVPPYFVFGRDGPADNPRAYRIGTRPDPDSILGWVPAERCVLWTSRVAVEPARRVNVYADRSVLEELVRTGRTTTKPFAVTRLGAERRPFLWPVARAEYVEHAGKRHELLEIHFLARPADAPGRAGRAAPPEQRQVSLDEADRAVRRLDVVFLFDSTGSMAPFFEGARKNLHRLAEAIAGAAEARFRLIAFRDRGSAYVTLPSPLGELGGFERALGEIDVDGGGDERERALDALDVALRTDWNADQLGQRVVFLASDAPFHEAAQIRSFVDRAKEARVRVFGLPVGSTTTKFRERYEKEQLPQLEALCEPTGGAVLPLEDYERAFERVSDVLQSTSETIERRTRVVAAAQVGASSREAIAERTGFAVEEVTEVLEFLEDGGVSFDFADHEGPAFFTGWVLASWKGAPLLKKKVLFGRSEVELALAHCYAARADLSPDSAMTMVGLGDGLRTANLQTFVPDARTDVASYMARRHGIPTRPDSVLRFSRVELERASEARRVELRQRLTTTIDALDRLHRDEAAWILRDSSGLAWGFVDEKLLP